MKTTLLTLALVAAAGVADAQTVSAPATGAAGATLNNSTVTNGNTGMQGAQMGVGTQTHMNGNVQSPATGQMNGGQMNMHANGAAGASVNPSLANAPSTQPATGAARTAQKRIEQDGYKSVQNLQRGADGLWHGTAMRGNTSVQVTVDRAGRVSAQ